ncbi:glycosyltransferase [Bacillus sp. SCS-151]|uniref:glycosyltransferase n=1 Tax=Nanhaiella sioensis TaxID=3115293 RepID=UPI003979188D
MKKKVLVLSNMYPNDDGITFGIFVKNQVEALRKQGLIVDVIAIDDPSNRKVNVIIKYCKWLLQALWTLLIKGRSYDVVHAHYVFPTGVIGLLFQQIHRTPLIVTAHGGDIDRMAKKNPRIRKWTQKILQRANHVIAVGQGLYDEMHEQYGVEKDKLSIVNMGVNRKVFVPYEKRAVRQQLGLKEHERPLIFVGNIIREKGLIELIEAFTLLKKEHKDAVLYVIGQSRNENFMNELQQKVSELQTADIKFLGALTQQELAKWMSAGEVFVLPSHMEGFGLVAVEAMSCHTPVVGSDVGGLSYLLANQHGILVQPQNADALYEGINAVLSDDQLKQQLINNGEKRAEENDEDTLIDKLISIYHKG